MCFIKDNAFFCSCPRGYYGVLCELNSEFNMLLKNKIQVIQQVKRIIFFSTLTHDLISFIRKISKKNSALACWIIGITLNKSK